MAKYPEIVEVVGPAEQGFANAYRCIANDGCNYYVKSEGSTWRGLVCEWVAARLAQVLGLPIAKFAQVDLAEDFADFLRSSGNYHLVKGLAFGSRAAIHVREFEPALLLKCSPQFRRDLVAFDWWVKNADRTLGEYAGNPNLLWDTEESVPVVIDHNMAFDCEFEAETFLETHIFRADLAVIKADLVMRAQYQQRFSTLVPLLDDIWAELPQNWLINEDNQVRVLKSDFYSVLNRTNDPNFWDVKQ
jgi:hypothetical protein